MKRIGPGPKYVLPPTVGHKNHDLTKARLPMYSFGYRSMAIKKEEGPGPGRYNLENQSYHGKKYVPTFMGRRTGTKKEDPGPGPAKYKLQDLMGENRSRTTSSRAPEFSMGHRYPDAYKNQDSPGAATFALPGTIGNKTKNIYGNKSPAYSFRARTAIANDIVSPGPSKYNPRIPDWRLGVKLKPRFQENYSTCTPGPNRYNLQAYKPKHSDPAYSMGLSLGRGDRPAMNPIVPCDNE